MLYGLKNKLNVLVIMKKFVLFVLLMLPVTVFAQKDVTTFLGIPVDGSKMEFIGKLTKKGFQYNASKDILTGQFNGSAKEIIVQTNNDKVCRIVVTDQDETREKSDIIIKFNKLINQFRNNQRYAEYPPNEEIESGTDISYEMMIKNKRYQAQFYQKPIKLDPEDEEKYSALQEKIEEIKSSNNLSAAMELLGNLNTYYRKYLMNKLVWFMINESYGKYSIAIFYENGYNMANGEDL